MTAKSSLAEILQHVQQQIRADFEKTRLLPHSGDAGTAREDLIRRFLEDGYLPHRYEVAPGSSHVFSTSGHRSKQIDLLLYDRLSTPRLLSAASVGIYPVECCYGMIEIKTGIDKWDTLRVGLENVAAFKRLQVRQGRHLSPHNSFGVIVAYEGSLKDETLLEKLCRWESEHDRQEWPNLIAILDRGVFGHFSQESRGLSLHTSEIVSAQELQPSRLLAGADDTLLYFYLCLVDLLNAIALPPTSLHYYASLPNTTEKHSYDWLTGNTAECEKHERYRLVLSEETLERILDACPVGAERDLAEVLNEATGTSVWSPGHLPVKVCSVYNPDKHPLSKIMSVRFGAGSRAAQHQLVQIDGRVVSLPGYYVFREQMTPCPHCDPVAIPAELTPDVWQDALGRRSVDP